MPYARRYRKVAARRKRPVTRYVKRMRKRYARKPKDKRPIRALQMYRPIGQVFPVKGFKVKQTYFEDSTISWSSTGGGVPYTDFDNYRANSVYDPRYNVGGQSAGMFSLIAQNYTNYKVVSSRITVRAAISSSGTSIPRLLLIAPIGGASSMPNTYNEAKQYIREGRARGIYFPATSANATKAMKTVTMSASTKRMQPYTNELDLWGSTSSNPTVVWYWKTAVYNCDGTNFSALQSANVQGEIRIDYNVRWQSDDYSFT